MARPLSLNGVASSTLSSLEEGQMVSGDALRKSWGISKPTLHRWLAEFQIKSFYIHNRLYLERKSVREFEHKAMSGLLGQRPRVGAGSDQKAELAW
jgi:hypothetical protein